MRKTTTFVSLAASALFVLAACSGETEPAATDPAIPELQDQVGQLQTQLDELGTRLGTTDLAEVESRLSELESQLDLLAAALEQQQEPSSLGGSTGDAPSSSDAPDATDDPDDAGQDSGSSGG